MPSLEARSDPSDKTQRAPDTARSAGAGSDSDSESDAAIARTTWRVDVSDVVPLPGRFEIAVDVTVPRSLVPDAPCVVLSCLPGGYLSRRYFDLRVDPSFHSEEEDPNADPLRYSFAEAMARQGFVTLAFDHVGVGESSKPDPIEGGYALGVEDIARANQLALELALERLAHGDDSAGIPAVGTTTSIGVGHSMGSLLTVEQQALAHPHRALLLFTFSTRGLPAFLDEAQSAFADDPKRVRAALGELTRTTMGSPYPPTAADSEEGRVAAFGVGTAPPSAEEVLHDVATNLLGLAGLLSMIPDGYGPPAREIDVPVFIVIGDHDLQNDRGLAEQLPRSPEVSTFVLEDAWHCHFVANSAPILWKRVAEWVHAQTV